MPFTLTWTASVSAVSTVVGYRLYRSVAGEDDYSLLDTIPAGTLEYEDEEYDGSTEYDYRITGYSANGYESLPSNVISSVSSLGSILLWPNAVTRQQVQTLGSKTINGYRAVAGQVVIADIGGPAAGYAVIARTTATDGALTVEVSGLDPDGNPTTDILTLGADGTYWVRGDQLFSVISGVEVTSSFWGPDAHFYVGVMTIDGAGPNYTVTAYAALALASSQSSGAIPVTGILIPTALPWSPPGNALVNVIRYANSAAKNVTINGSEVIPVPATVGVPGVGTVEYATINSMTLSGASGTIFLDVGIQYEGPEPTP